jgi:hypothetical protein
MAGAFENSVFICIILDEQQGSDSTLFLQRTAWFIVWSRAAQKMSRFSQFRVSGRSSAR